MRTTKRLQAEFDAASSMHYDPVRGSRQMFAAMSAVINTDVATILGTAHTKGGPSVFVEISPEKEMRARGWGGAIPRGTEVLKFRIVMLDLESWAVDMAVRGKDGKVRYCRKTAVVK